MDKRNRERLQSLPEDEQLYRRERRWLVCHNHSDHSWVRMPLIEMDTKSLNRLVTKLEHLKHDIKHFCGADVAETLDIEQTVQMIQKVRDAKIVERYNEST